MKTDVYNQEGKIISQTDLPESIFGIKVVPDLLHQVVVSQMANRRQGTAHTKDRGDVRGGGKKPWRQKGTGRARHGSIRSPLWKGGGVTFGPTKDKVYDKKIPKIMRKKAILMVLSAKAQNQLLILLDKFEIVSKKTKEMAQILQSLPCKTHSVLIVPSAYNADLLRVSRNIPEAAITPAQELNALDLLSFKYLIMPKDSIKVLEKMFEKL